MSVGGSPVRAAICCECVVCASKDRRRLCGTAAALRGAVGPICRGKRRDLFGAKADATATRRRHRFWPWKLPRRCRTGVGTAQQRWLGLRLSRDAVRTEQKLDVAGVSEDHRTRRCPLCFGMDGSLVSRRTERYAGHRCAKERWPRRAPQRAAPPAPGSAKYQAARPKRCAGVTSDPHRIALGPSVQRGQRSRLLGRLQSCPQGVALSTQPWSPQPQTRRRKQRHRLC